MQRDLGSEMVHDVSGDVLIEVRCQVFERALTHLLTDNFKLKHVIFELDTGNILLDLLVQLTYCSVNALQRRLVSFIHFVDLTLILGTSR